MTAPELTRAPDTLGKRGRADIVFGLLRDLQIQQFRTVALQAANRRSDDDPCPNTQHESGRPMTYAERVEQLMEAERELVERYADLLPEIEKLIEEAG